MTKLTKEENSLSKDVNSFTRNQIDLIKATVAKGCTDDELQLFLYTAKHTGLDPLVKQIYAIKRKNIMTIQTSIDGLRLIAERTGRYAPGKEPTYTYGKNNELLTATAYVNKLTADGTWHEVGATAFFAEYAQVYNGALGSFWASKPHIMLAKCAESLALRRAFPAQIGPLYGEDEMPDPKEQEKKSSKGEEEESKRTKIDPTISFEQEGEIIELLQMVDQDFCTRFMGHLRKKGINEIREMPLTLFEGAKKTLEDYIDERSLHIEEVAYG